MCKLFMLTNISNINRKLLDAIKDAVTATDNHGFGYAALYQDGSIAGERTDSPKGFTAFSQDPNTLKTAKVPGIRMTYNRFGNLKSTKVKSLIAHGRFSTNEKGLHNAHPFIDNGLNMALVHNGIIENTGPLEKDRLKTSCDTELALHYWMDGGMEFVEKYVSGYYAFGVLDKAGYLHVARDNLATLYFSHSKKLDSFIIATTAQTIEEVAKTMKWTDIEPPMPLNANKYIVFDGNDIMSSRDIKPQGYSVPASQVARKSLGLDEKPEYKSDSWSDYKDDFDDYDDIPGYREDAPWHKYRRIK